ncbi:MAG: biotin transporter BioY [Bacillota bacterium]|jgi:biotin transport system substrate-specific component
MKIKDMTIVAMFSALTAVLSQVSIPLPFSPVPITLQTFAVFLTGAVLGSRKGTLALAIYVLIGLFGLPVFSQGKSGLPALVGPTGGYIIGFIPAVYIIGKVLEESEHITFLRSFGAITLGLVVVYTLGVIQLKFVLDLSLTEAVTMGVLPYLVFEFAKVIMGAYLGSRIRKAILFVFPERDS